MAHWTKRVRPCSKHWHDWRPGHADLNHSDGLIDPLATRTARCLKEGVLTSVHDGNIGSIFGIGFPAWTGGALQFIYALGVDAFAKRCAELATKYGSGFALTAEVMASLKQHQPVY